MTSMRPVANSIHSNTPIRDRHRGGADHSLRERLTADNPSLSQNIRNLLIVRTSGRIQPMAQPEQK